MNDEHNDRKVVGNRSCFSLTNRTPFFSSLYLQLSDNQLPTSKIRKRFVTNEEALAQQLNGLKRTSK
jgi:hypothetical protein